jgi:hypothetical protein
MSERFVKQIRTPHITTSRASKRGGYLSFKQAVISTIAPPLEWYRLTESSRNILNAVITTAAKEEINEASKPYPDRKRIDYLKGVYLEAHDVTRKSSNFESLEKMKEIVQHYRAILKNITPA